MEKKEKKIEKKKKEKPTIYYLNWKGKMCFLKTPFRAPLAFNLFTPALDSHLPLSAPVAHSFS